MKQTRNIIIGLVLGILVGIVGSALLPGLFPAFDTYLLKPVGGIFLNLIKMLVVPIVFVSITVGTMGISDPKKLGRMGAKTMAFFLITTMMAVSFAMVLAFVVKPGVEGAIRSAEGTEFRAAEAPSIMDTLVNIIPANPAASFAEGNMLQIIAFAFFIGMGLAMLGKKAKGLANLFEQANDLMMYLVQIIMLAAPYGAFALIASAVGSQGRDVLASLGMYFVVVLSALLIHMAVTYSLAVGLLGRMNPLTFFKGFSPAMAVAFSTSSSNATLPVSMKAAQDNLGVSKEVSSFVQPLGATVNMDGTAIMQGVAAVFIAQITGTHLSFSQVIMVVVTATLASIGTAGVPGVGLVMLAMVLEQVGLPLEPIGLILSVDRLLDMTRTAVNITGDAVCAVIVNRSEESRAAAQTQPVSARRIELRHESLVTGRTHPLDSDE